MDKPYDLPGTREITFRVTATITADATDLEAADAFRRVLMQARTWQTPFVRAGEHGQAGPFSEPWFTEPVVVPDPGPRPHYHDATGQEDVPCQCAQPGTYARQPPVPGGRAGPAKVCIGCEQPQGQPHLEWCPAVTGTLASLPRKSNEQEH